MSTTHAQIARMTAAIERAMAHGKSDCQSLAAAAWSAIMPEWCWADNDPEYVYEDRTDAVSEVGPLQIVEIDEAVKVGTCWGVLFPIDTDGDGEADDDDIRFYDTLKEAEDAVAEFKAAIEAKP